MENYLIEILAGVVGTASALLLFYLTLRNDKKKEVATEKSQKKIKLNYLAYLLENGSELIRKSERVLKKNIEDFTQNDLEFHELNFKSNPTLFKLKKAFEDDTYFTVYHEEYGDKNVHKINSITNTIEDFIEIENDILQLEERYRIQDAKNRDKFKFLVDDLLLECQSILSLKTLSEENQKKLQEIVNNFLSKPEAFTSIDFQYSAFIEKASALFQNEQTVDLVVTKSQFLEASVVYQSIKNSTTTLKQKLQNNLQVLEDNIHKFDTDIAVLLKDIKH